MSFWSTISFGLIKTTKDKERESAIKRADRAQKDQSIFDARQQQLNYQLANKQLDYGHSDKLDDNKTKVELAKIDSDKAKSIAESTGKWNAESAKYFADFNKSLFSQFQQPMMGQSTMSQNNPFQQYMGQYTMPQAGMAQPIQQNINLGGMNYNGLNIVC